MRSFVIFAVAIIALVGGVYYSTQSPDSESVEVPATDRSGSAPAHQAFPSFTLDDIDGNPRELKEWDGRHRLLNFWATWCAPCRREIPVLKAFQENEGDDGILVMGIAVDFAEDVVVYAETTQFNYPILIGQEDAMAVAESSGISFIAMPFTMIIARDGEYLGAYLGELHQEHLDEIRRVLGALDSQTLDLNAAKEAFLAL